MSIYATLWKLKFPKEGDEYLGCDWIEITAQGVPPHIGSIDSQSEDSYAAFLPPPVEPGADGDTSTMRAVVFVSEDSVKGTERHPQEYRNPLFVLTGEEYARITFEELHRRLCAALRGSRGSVVAEIVAADGQHKIIREKDEN